MDTLMLYQPIEATMEEFKAAQKQFHGIQAEQIHDIFTKLPPHMVKMIKLVEEIEAKKVQ